MSRACFVRMVTVNAGGFDELTGRKTEPAIDIIRAIYFVRWASSPIMTASRLGCSVKSLYNVTRTVGAGGNSKILD